VVMQEVDVLSEERCSVMWDAVKLCDVMGCVETGEESEIMSGVKDRMRGVRGVVMRDESCTEEKLMNHED
jgi:hypothetical protein